MTIHLGDTPDGKRFSIPVWHTGVFGQSGIGKTMLLKYMLPQAVAEGFRFLIIDSRLTNPEFAGIGQDIPLYLEESTDPDIFRSLIEQMRPKGKGNMVRYRGGFIEVCDGAKSFQQIGRRLEEKLADKKAIKGNTRTMYFEIKHDYDRLMKMLGKYEFSEKLQLADKSPISRMETRVLPSVALQGLVVRSVIEEIMRRGEKKLIVLIDEAPNFCHQEHFNPAKEAIQQLDNQGRSNQLFGWYSGQTLTGFDKANMKNLWYWAIGREMETNEAKAVYNTQTYDVLSVREIRRLKQQEFLAITPETTVKITVPHVEEKDLFKTTAIQDISSIATVTPDDKPEASRIESVTCSLCLMDFAPEEYKRHYDLVHKPEEEQKRKKREEFDTAIQQAEEDKKLKEKEKEKLVVLPDETDESLEEAMEEMAEKIVKGTPHQQEVIVEETVAQVVVTERIVPAEFPDDTVEGMLVILIKQGFFDKLRSSLEIHKEITANFSLAKSFRYGSSHAKNYRDDTLVPALYMLARKPYEVLSESDDGGYYVKGPRPIIVRARIVPRY